MYCLEAVHCDGVFYLFIYFLLHYLILHIHISPNFSEIIIVLIAYTHIHTQVSIFISTVNVLLLFTQPISISTI